MRGRIAQAQRSALRQARRNEFSCQRGSAEDLEFINQVPDDPNDMDKWVEECEKLNLYDAPLDAGAVVYEYWSKIALVIFICR